MAIERDSDIRSVFHLTDQEIGEIIGKSRQAVNQGLKRNELYFSQLQWEKLYSTLVKRAGQEKIVQLENYIADTNIDISEVKRQLSGRRIEAKSPSDYKFSKITVLIADLIHFFQEQPNCGAEIVRTVIQCVKLDKDFEILTNTGTQKHFFLELVRQTDPDATILRAVKDKIAVIVEADQYPIILSFELNDGYERAFLTCIQDNFIEPSQKSYATIFFHARAAERVGQPQDPSSGVDPVMPGYQQYAS